MHRPLPFLGKRPARRKRKAAHLQVELLEHRQLLSGAPLLSLPKVPEWLDHPTLTQAQPIGDLTSDGGVVLQGGIHSASVGGEIDWFRFELSEAARISIAGLPDSTLPAIFSLYNSDPFDFGDYYNPTGNRLLNQSADALTQALSAGTYYLAVSGAGNRSFSPFLADSGFAGATGEYSVAVTANSLGLTSDDGPRVLAVDPASGATLASSPLVLRINFSVPLDPGTISPGDNVNLLYSPNGSFSPATNQYLDVGNFNVSSAGDELQLLPGAPLLPGYYRLQLGTSLTDLAGLPLGADVARPEGRNFVTTFRVNSIEGGHANVADDTAATAHRLGNLTDAGFVQVAGAIGDDATDPYPFNPADVDLYRFSVTGAGNFALTAEAFARRIGSRLDVALSLFQYSAVDQQLHLLASNDNTLNTAYGSNDSLPLFSDAALLVGLIAGEYFLAVSSHDNMPDLVNGPLPGVDGVFDPNITQSGQYGSSTGAYLLNLGIHADSERPEVVASNPLAGATLDAPPTRISVQFSEPVNLQTLAFRAYQQGGQSGLPAVYLVDADGAYYFPRLESWDDATHQATFLMLDGLANGEYQLHFSGPLGLADFAANPLVGIDALGDYVVPFTVAGPQRGTPGDPLTWVNDGSGVDVDQPQMLGVLFPHELQINAGVSVTRDAGQSVTGSGDFYQFQVLQSRQYFFNLLGSGLTAGASVTLYDSFGNVVPGFFNGQILQADLAAGTYTIAVGGWTPGQADAVAYELRINLGGAGENPTALTVGPAPLLQLRLSDPFAGSPVPTPVPFAPAGTGSGTSISPYSAFLPPEVLLSLGGGPIGGVNGRPAQAPALALFNGNPSAGASALASAGFITGTDVDAALFLVNQTETGPVVGPSAPPPATAIEIPLERPAGLALPVPTTNLRVALPGNGPDGVGENRMVASDAPEETPPRNFLSLLSRGVLQDPWGLVLLALTVYGSLTFVHSNEKRFSRDAKRSAEAQ